MKAINAFTPKKYNLQRKDITGWDESYLILSEMVAMLRSKDPSTQVGSFIADAEHKPISFGYNGSPAGWPDDEFPWGKTSDDEMETKYPFVVHSERNCILNSPKPIPKGCTLYVSLFPCNNCAQEIAQSGIKRLVYRERSEGTNTDESDLILKYAGVECIQMPPLNVIRLIKLIITWSGMKTKDVIKALASDAS